MVNMVQLGLRVAELIFVVIIMGLDGNIIAGAFSGNPSVINYIIFVTVFSMLTLFYLIASSIKEELSFHKFIPSSMDVLNVLFFFCAAVALAAELGAHSCSNGVYTLHNRITNGAYNREGRCREAQAVTFFLWITWACFCVSLFFSLQGSGGVNMRSTRRPGPSMSQV